MNFAVNGKNKVSMPNENTKKNIVVAVGVVARINLHLR